MKKLLIKAIIICMCFVFMTIPAYGIESSDSIINSLQQYADSSDLAKLQQPLPNIQKSYRIEGKDRLATCLNIATILIGNEKVNTIIVAAAYNYPDAICGVPLAKELNTTVLLVSNKSAENKDIYNFIQKVLLPGGKIIILGQYGAVPYEIEEDLKALGNYSIDRIGGKNRYETSALIADRVGCNPNADVFLCSGQTYKDATTISSTSALNGSPVLLVDNNDSDNIYAINVLKKISCNQIWTFTVDNLDYDQMAKISTTIGKLVRLDDAGNIYDLSLGQAYDGLQETSSQINVFSTGKDYPDLLEASLLCAYTGAHNIACDRDAQPFGSTLHSLKVTNASTCIFLGNTFIDKELSNWQNTKTIPSGFPW